MGAHSAGKRVRAPGRHHRINQALETVTVLGILAIVMATGWATTEPVAAPASVLNPPVVAAVPSRPAERGVPPVPAALLSHDTTTPAVPNPKATVTHRIPSRTCS